ncbi:MAG: hypothetical protein DCC75_10365, partial [Proteobacteria bacterium]
MQQILSIDASSENGSIQVLAVEERKIKLLESHNFQSGDFFSKISARNGHPLSGAEQTHSQGPLGDAYQEGMPEASASEQDTAPAASNPLRDTLAKVTSPWTSAVLLVPAQGYFSLNVELPFSDARNINRVLDLEIQDQVPFDVSEFLIEHRALDKRGAKAHDIHVSVIPKDYIREIIKSCRESGLEPYIVTLPTTALGAIFDLAPDYYSGDSAVIYAQDPLYYVGFRVNGKFRTDRVINRLACVSSREGSTGQESIDLSKDALLMELKLSILATETKYATKIEKVWVCGESIETSILQQALGRDVEWLNYADLIEGPKDQVSLASLAAIYAQDIKPPALLTNFRVKEFTYRPQLGELIAGLRRLVPYLSVLLLCFILSLICIYISREGQIQKMQDALRDRIASSLPGAPIPAGEEAKFLQGINSEIEQELKDLGTPYKYSPLDILLELTRDVPEGAGAMVRTLNIRGNQIKMEGAAPNYPAVDQIERALRARRSLYCRVNREQATSAGLGG